MRRLHPIVLVLLVAASCSRAAAGDDYFYSFNGYADLRLVHPADSTGVFDGGPGKTRWGNDGNPEAVAPELGAIVLRASAVPTPALRAVAEFRYDSQQKTALDIVDAFVRYRPVSITRWRWSVKAGAFFPPISLENTDLGWTSPWTLTPSAINSWVGDELRTIGGEASIEWRGDVDYLTASAALMGWNQPAGVGIALRGWTFDDNPTGLLGHLRLPDAIVEGNLSGNDSYRAVYEDEFRQIDGNPGWYATASWERPDLGRLTALYYDNNADPAAPGAWHTKFWSAGASTQFGNVVVMAQGMVGSTEIHPVSYFTSSTDFRAAYLLAGWEQKQFRYALRLDDFGTSTQPSGALPEPGEHGTAVTAAVTWKPRRWMRIISEVLYVDSWRPQRLLYDDTPAQAKETQVQLALRVSF